MQAKGKGISVLALFCGLGTFLIFFSTIALTLHYRSYEEVTLFITYASLEIAGEEEEPLPNQSEEQQKTKKAGLSIADFEQKFTRDPHAKQYSSGRFVLMDGEITTADYYYYSSSNLFNSASAIFKDGQLASIKIDRPLSTAGIDAALEVKFAEDVTIEQTESTYEIIFDSQFATENIMKFPFEAK